MSKVLKGYSQAYKSKLDAIKVGDHTSLPKAVDIAEREGGSVSITQAKRIAAKKVLRENRAIIIMALRDKDCQGAERDDATIMSALLHKGKVPDRYINGILKFREHVSVDFDSIKDRCRRTVNARHLAEGLEMPFPEDGLPNEEDLKYLAELERTRDMSVFDYGY